MVKLRTEVKEEDKWNVAALYPDLADWEKNFTANEGNKNYPRWTDLVQEKGKLHLGEEHVKQALDRLTTRQGQLEKLYTYAHLRHDEDITHDAHKAAFKRISNLLHDFSRETSWFEPELLALPSELLERYIKSPELAPYRFHLEKIVRMKEHTLDAQQEELLALAGKALQAPHKAFSALNDADFKFGKIVDGEGKERELTHASYALFIRDRDRALRKNSFKMLHGKYVRYEQTLCELLNGQMERHLFEARARKYSSCLEAALYPKNIDTGVYHALIQTVRENRDALHSYMDFRRKVLNLDQLHPYDLYVPLTKNVEITFPYQEAEELVITSVAPLGRDYQERLRKGFQQQRWVDRFENRNKRSGAYSSGCYGTMPYILMNYKNLLRDVFTLAHEAGHSMHSDLSRSSQPYHYSDYPIFVAEVASTFNEELLADAILERIKTKEEKAFLLNEKLEEIRGTLFRQTLFAEFELWTHTMVENGTPLTPKLVREKYRQLNSDYFGEAVVIDEELDSEWARIPHFYYNYYVYQYATGISAAIALSERVKRGGDPARDAYLTFLKGGCSRFPLDLLRSAGVEMCSSKPVEAAIEKFRTLLQQLKEILPS